jgi:hypothetical protein
MKKVMIVLIIIAICNVSFVLPQKSIVVNFLASNAQVNNGIAANLIGDKTINLVNYQFYAYLPQHEIIKATWFDGWNYKGKAPYCGYWYIDANNGNRLSAHLDFIGRNGEHILYDGPIDQ